MKLLKEEKDEDLERGTRSYFSKGGFFGHMTSEFKMLRPERRKMYEDAA